VPVLLVEMHQDRLVAPPVTEPLATSLESTSTTQAVALELVIRRKVRRTHPLQQLRWEPLQRQTLVLVAQVEEMQEQRQPQVHLVL
jgi:hypothetical protein